jgi:hypothetical protein
MRVNIETPEQSASVFHVRQVPDSAIVLRRTEGERRSELERAAAARLVVILS